MKPLDRVLDFFWWNHADRDEERQWVSSGSFPEVVERAYRNERDFERDAKVLNTMGYRVVDVAERRAATTMAMVIASDDVTQLIHVRYERQGDALMAPGAEISDPNPPAPTA